MILGLHSKKKVLYLRQWFHEEPFTFTLLKSFFIVGKGSSDILYTKAFLDLVL